MLILKVLKLLYDFLTDSSAGWKAGWSHAGFSFSFPRLCVSYKVPMHYANMQISACSDSQLSHNRRPPQRPGHAHTSKSTRLGNREAILSVGASFVSPRRWSCKLCLLLTRQPNKSLVLNSFTHRSLHPELHKSVSQI